MTDPVAIRYAPGTKERKTTMMWIWLLLLLMLIFWACAWIFGLPSIAKSLTSDTEDALEKAGYENVDIDFDGREANLTGTVSADGKAIDAKVEDVEGVRWANSDLTTEKAAPAPAPTTTTTTTAPPKSDATFSAISGSDGKITLSGNVASTELAAANVAEAAAVVGASNVIDEQTVTDVEDSSWMPGVPSALGSLDGVEEPSVEIADDRAVIRGTVDSEATKTRIGTSWENALTGATVDNQLVVREPEPAPVDNCTNDRLRAVAEEGTEGGLFVTARAELTEAYQASLDNVVAVLAECPDIEIEVGGHTDSRGSDAYNLNLSQARADAVVAYLVSQGVDDGRLTGVGYGETDLQVENEQTAADLAQNRRIEFKPSN